MFIRLMLGGQSLLENGLSDCYDVDKVEDSDAIDRDGDDDDDVDDDDDDEEEEDDDGLDGGLDGHNVAEDDEVKQPNKQTKKNSLEKTRTSR